MTKNPLKLQQIEKWMVVMVHKKQKQETEIETETATTETERDEDGGDKFNW